MFRLIILAAVVYSVSFAASAVHAIDRDWYYGYFTNSRDTSGDDVLQNNANDGGNCSGTAGNRSAHYNSSTGGYDSIKVATNSADAFINEIKEKLYSNRCDTSTANNAKNWDNTGAAFIIQTMIGTSRNRPPTAGEVADWENRVRAAANAGRVNWNVYASAAPNTFYQINRSDGSSSVNDVAWFNSTGSGQAIVFYNSSGGVQYIIRRPCANTLGSALPLENGWYAAGSTTVSDGVSDSGDTPYSITTTPGATLTFSHRIKDLGPSGSANWYEIHKAHSVEGTYQADYYANTSLSGSPSFTRYEAGIYHNWDGDGIDSPIGNNNFSVRWTRSDYFPAGTYTFSTATDDGVRLYIDGSLVINDWNTHGVIQNNANVTFSAGRHTVVMEYFQGAGGYYAAMWYSYMQGSTKVSTAYDAQYYNTTDLSGSPAVTRTDPEVNFRWSTNAPVSGINADNYSVRWTRNAYFPAGTYEFMTRTDDGVRLYIDNTLIINDWNGHPTTTNTASRAMTEGVHKVVMEYYEGAVTAEAGLSWYERIQGGTDGGGYSPGQEKTVTTKTMTVPANAAPGTKYCQSILWDWATYTGGQVMYGGGGGGSADMGGMACATVVGNYDLNPNANPNVSQAQVGDTITFTYTLANVGTTSSPSVTCTAKDGSGATVSVSFSCSNSIAANGNAVTVGTENISVTAAMEGTSVCRTLTVAPATPSVSSRTSTQRCVLIVTKPYMRVYGGDVSAGNGLASTSGTCTPNANGTVVGWNRGSGASYAGAGAQYAVLVMQHIQDFSSTLSSASGAPEPAGLSFANTPINTGTGEFGRSLGSLPCIPNYYGMKPASATTLSGSTVNPNTLASGSYAITGPITLTSTGSIANKVDLYVDGDVFISNNIPYTTGWSVANMPRFRLIARGNIVIDNDTSSIDGLYIAQRNGTSGGTINTCSTSATILSPYDSTFYDQCNNQKLTVNGALVANSIQFARTINSLSGAAVGETGAAGKAAEVFNYGPIMWISQPNSPTSSAGRYDSITTLPPIL